MRHVGAMAQGLGNVTGLLSQAAKLTKLWIICSVSAKVQSHERREVPEE